MIPPPLPASAAGLPLARSIQFGDFRLHAIEAGLQWLDGGAMFGVVPKPLWERRIPPDLRNRIPLALRCLLVETRDQLVLIETGIGNKETEKFIEIYGVDNSAEPILGGADRLQSALVALGFSPHDVTVVVNTHLHFDHAGGNTYRDPEGAIRLAFPYARYHVQQGEWEYAHRTNERTRASYLPPNFAPVAEARRWEFLGPDAEVVPGIRVRLTPGHTPHHQSVLVASAGATACYMGDVAPTMAHLPLPWIMGYDVEPLVTLESKRSLFRQAAEERWLLISTHDPVTPWGYAATEGKELGLEPVGAETIAESRG